MKKLVLGTAFAALSMAPAVAGPIAVTVGGYYNSMVYLVDSDATVDGDGNPADYRDDTLQEDAEIIFKGKGIADNGIEYGFQVQLEASTSNDQIDEHYIYVKGGFGQVILGAENSAAYLMQVSAPSFLGWKTFDNNFETWSEVAKYEKPLHDNYSADANKVTYMTPKVGGFQFGVSLTPSAENSGGAGAGTTMLLQKNNGKYEDVMSYGVSYGGDLGGAKVKLSYTYEEGERDNIDDSEYAIGAQLGFGNLTIGGHYFESDEPNDNDPDHSDNDWEIMHYGVAYKMGDTTLGFAIQNQEDAASSSSKNDTDILILGGSTKLMSGVKLTYSYEQVQSDNAQRGDSDFIGVGLLLKF